MATSLTFAHEGPTTYIYDIGDPRESDAAVLGAKGAALATMRRLGLPVPAGFTITTEASRRHPPGAALPVGLSAEIDEHVAKLESRTGRSIGSQDNPLLLSVRSASASDSRKVMPTVLNVGLNDQSVRGLAAHVGDERFAFDSYRRLIQTFATTVLSVDEGRFAAILAAAAQRAGTPVSQLPADELRRVVAEFKSEVVAGAGWEFPQDPREQLRLSVAAALEHWRAGPGAGDSTGMAITVLAMVFGNRGERSGVGVAYSRDPVSGRPAPSGDFLVHAQGDDVLDSRHHPEPLDRLRLIDPGVYTQLARCAAILERHMGDLCRIAFTVEAGDLWLLDVARAERSPAAEVLLACQLCDEGVIDLSEAVSRAAACTVSASGMLRATPMPETARLDGGIPGSPGAAAGALVLGGAGSGDVAVLSGADAESVRDGDAAAVILVGAGVASRAADAARAKGVPCVCFPTGVRVDPDPGTLSGGEVVASAGQMVTVDGSTGATYLGAVELEPLPIAHYVQERLEPRDDDAMRRIVRAADPSQRDTLVQSAPAVADPDAVEARS